MTIHATFVGRLVAPPKQFGNLIVLRAVHNPGKTSNYESVFVDIKLKGDGFQGPAALKFVQGDDVTAIGELQKEKWKNGKGESIIMNFPRLEIPYAIRMRDGGAELAEQQAAEADEDPFAGIPA